MRVTNTKLTEVCKVDNKDRRISKAALSEKCKTRVGCWGVSCLLHFVASDQKFKKKDGAVANQLRKAMAVAVSKRMQ